MLRSSWWRVTVVSMTTPEPLSPSRAGDLVLRLATVAYLARYTGSSRAHTESDLRLYLTWCLERDLAPWP